MMPQNAQRPLHKGAAGAFPAQCCGMAIEQRRFPFILLSPAAKGHNFARRSAISLPTGAPGENSMSMRMLIDARHPEETRVAVVKGNRIEEFDFESAEHKQLKGNIYLAKVTRVEPSLQAAFVDYGGNRHGFLAFSEIHPDYYQIPKADREALLREEAEHAAEEERAARRRVSTTTSDDDRCTTSDDRRRPTRDDESERRRATRPTRAGTGSAPLAGRRIAPPTSFAASARTCAAATRSRT